MFASEAARLREILLAAGEVSPLLNLGSSTGHFRKVEKPHIETELFAPLRDAGIEVVHCDLKPAEGVDVAGDILDPQVQASLATRGFRCVLLSNLLEHVTDRTAVAKACEAIAGAGGLVLVTVPSSFPFHADPIDTGYRPKPQDLAAVFAGSDAVLAEEVEGPTYRERLREEGRRRWRAAANDLVGACRPSAAQKRPREAQPLALVQPALPGLGRVAAGSHFVVALFEQPHLHLAASKRSSASLRPAAPIFRRWSGEDSSWAIRVSSKAVSCSGTRKPVSPSITASAIPPCSLATTGRPEAAASTTTLGSPSASPLFAVTLGAASRAQRRRRLANWSGELAKEVDRVFHAELPCLPFERRTQRPVAADDQACRRDSSP